MKCLLVPGLCGRATQGSSFALWDLFLVKPVKAEDPEAQSSWAFGDVLTITQLEPNPGPRRTGSLTSPCMDSCSDYL